MIVAATDALFLLAVLACPVGMLLMMWFMGRGMLMGKREGGGETASLPDLEAEQARLAAKIDALKAAGVPQVQGERTEAETRSE